MSIPNDLKRRMSEHPRIKWSEVVRAVLEQQISEIEETGRLASKSRLTEKDVEALALAADGGIAKRWKDAARR